MIISRSILQKYAHTINTYRLVRAQPIYDKKGFYAHFGVLVMFSHGKKTGSYSAKLI
jgi:hypothetical protein